MSLATPQPNRVRTQRKGTLRAYRFELNDGVRMVYIGPICNREQAKKVLREKFGDALINVRVHPLFDPWPKVSSATQAL